MLFSSAEQLTKHCWKKAVITAKELRQSSHFNLKKQNINNITE